MNASTVKRIQVRYEASRAKTTYLRSELRGRVIQWKDNGATIVEIADLLGWSRQSVYDLIGEK